MVDVANFTPNYLRPRKVLSPLMEAKNRNQSGAVVNACPFGCQDNNLDANGYCKHLIGFTNPDDQKQYFPVVDRPGALPPDGSPGSPADVFVDGRKPLPVLPGDKLVLISVASRVYREKPEPITQPAKTGKAG